MPAEPQLTSQTILVLDALLSSRGQAGAAIAKETGLRSGTLYPILLRLERAGWLSSEWEEEEPSELGRPRRRFYQVTAAGAAKARQAAKAIAPAIGRLAVS